MIDLSKLLKSVEKPSRYTGGEYNSPAFKPAAALNYLLCFPDVYEVAMSNLGIKILQGVLNRRADTNCERCFAPWIDMGALLKKEGVPLFSLETRRAAKEFDIMGFSLQYELSYTNVLYMLDLAGIPFLRKDRTKGNFPILMAGGPCAVNPLPLEDIFDIFVIGDGEELIDKLAALYIEAPSVFLKKAAELQGVYVPSIHKQNGGRQKVKRAVIPDLNKAYFPTEILVPNIEAVHDRAVVEIFRGCGRGCRFCQAGYIYRPVRNRSVELCKSLAQETIAKTGFDEVTLSSLSSGDYPHLQQLVKELQPMLKESRVNLALPSQRLDSFESDLELGAKKSGGLTFAPEAGTQRLRDVIRKNITDAHIDGAVTAAYRAGFSTIKLYFMLGLPTETDADIQGIAETCRRIKRLYGANAGVKRRLNLSVSCSVFIPKPFTPFQWEGQIAPDEARRRQQFLKDELRKIGVSFHYHDMAVSRLEAAFSRGDERLNRVLIKAYEGGCKFDGWTELFMYENWLKAFENAGVEIEDFLKAANPAEPLPWEFIDIGVSRDLLLREKEQAYSINV